MCRGDVPTRLEIQFFLNLEFKPYLMGVGKVAAEDLSNGVIVRRVDARQINKCDEVPVSRSRRSAKGCD
jgi:hypothetical protein